jgi:hypothetical protein
MAAKSSSGSVTAHVLSSARRLVAHHSIIGPAAARERRIARDAPSLLLTSEMTACGLQVI